MSEINCGLAVGGICDELNKLRAQAALLESYRKADIEADKMREEIKSQAATIAGMRNCLERIVRFVGDSPLEGAIDREAEIERVLSLPTSHAEARYNAMDELLRHIIDAGNDKDTWASYAQSAEALRFIVEKAGEVRKLEER